MRTTLQPAGPMLLAVALLAFGGCTSLNPRPDYDRAADHVRAAVGHPIEYRPGDDTVAARVTELLAGGLTIDEAVQVCLLNNAQLQAAFEDVGVARADYVQSGLFSNPTVSVAVRFPDGGGMAGLEADLAQNIAELWQIPYRQKAAERQLDRAVLELARRAAGLALDTKAAYFQALRADREHELARETLALTQQLIEIAVARRDAGSGSEIDVSLAQSQHLDAEVRLRAAERDAAVARADLARVLGLTLSPDELVLTDRLDDPRDWQLTANEVVAVARGARLDLRIAAETVGAALAQVGYQKTRFLREIEVGVSMERDARASRGDRNWLAETAWASLEAGQLAAPSFQPRERETTDWTVGPTISAEIPLFDQNQAQIARAQHEYEQARRLLEALNRDLVQDAWQTLKRAAAARDTARLYADKILPLRERSLGLAREAYRSGRVTFLSVLEAQRELLGGRVAYVQALQDSALAIVELERLTGRPATELFKDVAPTTDSASDESLAPPDSTTNDLEKNQ